MSSILVNKGDVLLHNGVKKIVESIYEPTTKNWWRIKFYNNPNCFSVKNITHINGNPIKTSELVPTQNNRTIDLAGQKFNKLKVLSFAYKNKRDEVYWNCICDCGNYSIVRSNNLKYNHTTSCGCYQEERLVASVTTHGFTSKNNRHPSYNIWLSIKDRCYNKNNIEYHNYGGRGIKVCDRWLNSFENFIEDMGERPSSKHSIDRYPNTNGNYEPNNCRWATSKQQARNLRRNVWKEYDGIKMIIADWAIVLKTNTSVIYFHLSKGKSFDIIVKSLLNKKNLSWNLIKSAFVPVHLEHY